MRWLAALVALGIATPLAAQAIPEPSPANPRIQTVRFQPGMIIELTALPASGLTVVFEPGERIESVDADETHIEARITSERDGLLLIPKLEGNLGRFAVKTDRRSYRFGLRTATDLMAAYLVQFVSGPPVPISSLAGASMPTTFPPMQALMASPVPAGSVWAYRLKGDAALQPASITDDGKQTIIAFSEGAPLPAIFAVGPSGNEQVVNGYMRAGRFVIDEIWSELVFRIDRKKATARRNREPERSDG